MGHVPFLHGHPPDISAPFFSGVALINSRNEFNNRPRQSAEEKKRGGRDRFNPSPPPPSPSRFVAFFTPNYTWRHGAGGGYKFYYAIADPGNFQPPTTIVNFSSAGDMGHPCSLLETISENYLSSRCTHREEKEKKISRGGKLQRFRSFQYSIYGVSRIFFPRQTARELVLGAKRRKHCYVKFAS